MDFVDAPRVKRLRSNDSDDMSRMYQSQPEKRPPQFIEAEEANAVEAITDSRRTDFCFSQPTLMDDLLLSTQLNPTQSTSQNAFQRLVKRMTRFFVTEQLDETIKRLSDAVEELGCTWKISEGPVVIILH